jgi:hypothetical protein
MAVVHEIIDLLVCRKIHGCGCVGPSLTWKKYKEVGKPSKPFDSAKKPWKKGGGDSGQMAYLTKKFEKLKKKLKKSKKAAKKRALQYPAERYVGIQDCHIRDWQLARIYFSKESSTLVKVLKVYKLIATVRRTQYRNTVFHKGLSVPLFLVSDGVS